MMKGKETKKEKRYFCDLCEKVVADKPILLLLIAIVVAGSAVDISSTAISNYIDKQEEYIDLCDRYSDDAYKELKKDIQNQLEKGGRMEEVVDSYEGSFDGVETVYDCSKTNENGFVVKMTVTISKKGEILSADNQFKTKEEYVEQVKNNISKGKYAIFSLGIAVLIYFGTFALLLMLSKISKKHKSRDEAQKAKNKTGFEQ